MGRGRNNIELLLVVFLAIPDAYAQAPQGAQFQVNTYTTGDQRDPDISVGSILGRITVWDSRGEGGDGSGTGIRGRKFDAPGIPANEFQVNTYTTGDQLNPKVAVAPDGSFVVV